MHKIAYTRRDPITGQWIAYDCNHCELARGANGLEIVAQLWSRPVKMVQEKSEVPGVRQKLNGMWELQRYHRIVFEAPTRTEVEEFARTHKGKLPSIKKPRKKA